MEFLDVRQVLIEGELDLNAKTLRRLRARIADDQARVEELVNRQAKLKLDLQALALVETGHSLMGIA